MNPPNNNWDIKVTPEHVYKSGRVAVSFCRRSPSETDESPVTSSFVLNEIQARQLALDLLAVTEKRRVAPVPQEATKTTTGTLSKIPLPFTKTQGKYLAFILKYQRKYGCAPAESNIQRHMLVSAPSVNQMMQSLEAKGLIARTPGQARSIRLLVPPELIEQAEQ